MSKTSPVLPILPATTNPDWNRDIDDTSNHGLLDLLFPPPRRNGQPSMIWSGAVKSLAFAASWAIEKTGDPRLVIGTKRASTLHGINRAFDFFCRSRRDFEILEKSRICSPRVIEAMRHIRTSDDEYIYWPHLPREIINGIRLEFEDGAVWTKDADMFRHFFNTFSFETWSATDKKPVKVSMDVKFSYWQLAKKKEDLQDGDKDGNYSTDIQDVAARIQAIHDDIDEYPGERISMSKGVVDIYESTFVFSMDLTEEDPQWRIEDVVDTKLKFADMNRSAKKQSTTKPSDSKASDA